MEELEQYQAKIIQLEKSIDIYIKHTHRLDEQIEQQKQPALKIIKARNVVLFKDGTIGKLREGENFFCNIED